MDQMFHDTVVHTSRQLVWWKNISFVLFNETWDYEDVQDWNENLQEMQEALQAATDVDIDGVRATIIFNALAFVVLAFAYEILRRVFPNVYASRQRRNEEIKNIRKQQRQQRKAERRSQSPSRRRGSMADFEEPNDKPVYESNRFSKLPDLDSTEKRYPFSWVVPVFNISWGLIRKHVGLDAYFLLRYIRMCLKITAVSAIWGMAILFPVYATGKNGAQGWYHYSMANVVQGNSWRIWVPTVFWYVFTAHVFYVMKNEYKHYVEMRLDFLGLGDKTVNPQHHYSLMVEHIPGELRSDIALYDYFDRMFPGKVHSANVIMNLTELREISSRRERVVKRLEKSIAYFEATGRRPTHIVGQPRIDCLGIEFAPLEIPYLHRFTTYHDMERDGAVEKGKRVDSTLYYIWDLEGMNKNLFLMQKQKIGIADKGNKSIRAGGWFQNVSQFADMWIEESYSSDGSFGYSSGSSFLLSQTMSSEDSIELGEHKSKRVVSFEQGALKNSIKMNGLSFNASDVSDDDNVNKKSREKPLLDDAFGVGDSPYQLDTFDNSKTLGDSTFFDKSGVTKKEKRRFGVIGGYLGFDFLMFLLKQINRQTFKLIKEEPAHKTMTSTGFVTFTDLASVTYAAGVPLTHDPNTLLVKVAPEARDIEWKNIGVKQTANNRRENITNFFLTFGVFFWSIPIALIQGLLTSESIGSFPGMSWILYYRGGQIALFIDAYMPVVALLVLMLILPTVFQTIAESYERRKTKSEVVRSMVDRYFYYQLANIYVTVTAGSLWKGATCILNHPSALLEILGNSLPTVVGYFIALLVTKILAGLPLVMLRPHALFRYLFLRMVFRTKFLTQRDLDAVYCTEPVWYGWEYPAFQLVIVICFTYAAISPIILVVGAIYFMCALIVYKKQVCYVYSPEFESGGSFFPMVCDRTVMGLICGQVTFIGYSYIRGGTWEPFCMIPLLIMTFWMRDFFNTHYAYPSANLTMERAIELDEYIGTYARKKSPGRYGSPSRSFDRNDPNNKDNGTRIKQRSRSTTPNKRDKGPNFDFKKGASSRKAPRLQFSNKYYKQPVLTEPPSVPMPYRRGREDPLTADAANKLRDNRMHMWTSDIL